ncbi:MAG: carbohydrate porin [Pirellulales bacterium]
MNAPRYRSVGRVLSSLTLAAACSLPISAGAAETYWNDVTYLTSERTFADVDAGRTHADDFAVRDISYCDMSLASGWMERFQCCQQQMSESGIVYNGDLVQFYQGVTSGGVETGFEYGGKVDQFLTLDSTKLGLWQGMTAVMHVETRFGEDVNQKAVGLAPVNVAMLYPNADEHDTAITGLQFAQAVTDEVQLTFGKFNSLDLFYMLYPETGRGVNGFMNGSMVIPLAVARVFPLSFLGAGVLKFEGTQAQGGLMVYDPHNCTTTSGFENLGDNGVNIFGFWRFFTEVGGLPGSHAFGFSGATGEFTSLDPEGFVFVPGQGIVATQQSNSWAAIYILQQRLWQDGCNPDRNVGVLSQWCIADEDTSPFQWTGNVAIQGSGFVAARPSDSAGVGYFYTGLSSQFQSLVSPVLDLHDLHGVELYYNAALSKCFGLTSDLQVIEPADSTNDTAVVFGLRGVAVF